MTTFVRDSHGALASPLVAARSWLGVADHYRSVNGDTLEPEEMWALRDMADCLRLFLADQERVYTSEDVAWEQSIPVGQLLDSHLAGREATPMEWRIEDVPLDQLAGRYVPEGYYEDEAEYMAELEAAIDAGKVPPPALIKCEGKYHHADCAHRVVVAITRQQPIIQAYVGYCTAHA